ncbi:MAG: hypothetical protein ACRCUI_04625 [Polymorphobacter sp.]
MIPNLPIKTAGVATLALVMWVIPSLGTQGIGTIGHRVAHPDRRLVALADAGEAAGHDADAVLRAADMAVRTAMPRSPTGSSQQQ